MTQPGDPGGARLGTLAWRPARGGVGMLIGAAVLFAVGTNVQAGWVLVLSALLAGAVVAGAVLPLWALRHVTVTRSAPAMARAGDPVNVVLEASGVRWPVLLTDEFCGTGAVVASGPGSLPSVRTGAARGVYMSGTCTVSTGAPFGTATARRRLRIETQILVYPRIHDVTLPDDFGAGGFGVRRTLRGDAAGVREYRPGDPPRHVHWRASARTGGELLVREFESGGPVGLLIVVDPSASDLDAVAEAACSYAMAGLAEGRDVILDDGRAPLRPEGEREVLEWGARLQPGPAYSGREAGEGWTVVRVP